MNIDVTGRLMCASLHITVPPSLTRQSSFSVNRSVNETTNTRSEHYSLRVEGSITVIGSLYAEYSLL